jgi:APA family basic amino acid/polyamine antiporter
MTGILPLRQFAARDITPALNHAGKAWLTSLADAGTLLGMATVIMAAGYLQTRIVISMSEVRLFSKSWSNIQSNNNRPYFATLLMGMASAAAAALVPLSMLSELMNAGALIAYCSASVAVSVYAANH